jgi:hypothetical protein
MNILENFVNKFSIEQKSATVGYNENSNFGSGMLSKSLNTKSYLTNSIDAIYMDNYTNNNTTPTPIDINSFKSNSDSPTSSTCHDNTNTNKNTNSTVINSNCKKTMRNMFSYSQIEILENIFEQTHYPDSTMREKLR